MELKTVGLPISHKENERRRTLVPADIEVIRHPEQIYIEDGYSIDHEGNKTAETLVRPAEMMKNPEPAVSAPKWEAGKF